MEDICMICSELKDSQVPKLTCGHYICPKCYCERKCLQEHLCLLCNKKMKRRGCYY